MDFRFSLAGMEGDRIRDVLPLPHIKPGPCASWSPQGGQQFESTRAKRNRIRRADNLCKANEVIDSINEMAGFKSAPKAPANQAQVESQKILLQRIARLDRPAERINTREAIHELLHLCPSSDYMPEEGTRSTVRPYDRSLVSLPDCGASAIDATHLLDDRGREILEQFDSCMLAPDWVQGQIFEKGTHIKPYMDEVLRSSPQVYSDFIKDLFDRGMLEFRRSATSIITPFFVAKKNGKIRLVLDCRATNQLFEPPPDIALAAGYSFGRLEIGEGQTLYTAQSDVKDYFYSIGLPEGLRGYFCLPSVSASQLGFDIEGFSIDDEHIYPALKVVPMGWSWAMWIAQRIHQYQATVALNVPVDQVLADGRPAPSLVEGKPVLIPYADNLNVCGTDREAVQNAKQKVVKHLRELNFRIHEEQDATPVVQALGFEVNGDLGIVRPIARKRERLRLVLLWLSTRPRISGASVERVIGHCIHMFMVRREFLSIFRAMYDFKKAHYRHPYRLWRSAAQECKWAAAMLLVSFSDMRRPWSTEATVSDACLSGTAVSSLSSSREEVRQIGQCREMWRFKARDPLHRARDSVFALDPFKDLASVKPVHEDQTDRFQLNLDFQHVPEKFACSSEWRTQFSSRMHFPEHITILESRATIQAMRHKVRSSQNFGQKHLHCGDNLGMVLAFDRGRAKSIPLLFCCRRAAAISVAADSVFTHRWLPSEFNAADGPSRQWEGPSNEEASQRKKRAIIDAICYPNAACKSNKDSARQLLGGALSIAQGECQAQTDKSSAHQEAASPLSSGEGRNHTSEQEATAGYAGSAAQQRAKTDSARGRSSGSTYSRGVLVQDPIVHSVLPDPEVEASQRERVGRVFSPLSQPILHGGMDVCRGRKMPCGSLRLENRATKRSSQPKPSSSSRLEKLGSRCHATTSRLASHRLDCADNGRTQFSVGGNRCAGHVRDLCSSQRGLLSQAQRPCSQRCVGPRVVLEHASIRGDGGIKNRCEQRDDAAQLSGGPMVGAGIELPLFSSRGPTHPIQLRPGDSCLESSTEVSQSGKTQVCALPTASLRSQLGQVQKLQRHSGGQAQGPMGFRSQSQAIRAARNGGSTVRIAARTTQKACSSGASAPPELGPWQMWPDTITTLKPALELFSGCAALSRALVSQGFPVEAWDLEYNKGCDLLSPHLVDNLINRIQHKSFSFVHLGLPCTTWSRARRDDRFGPGPLRDDHAHIWGLPHLSKADQHKVNVGNRLLLVAVRILEACIASNTPWSLENPLSSRLWLTPQLRDFIPKGAIMQPTTYCMFGTPWRKATAFMTWHCPDFQLPCCGGPFYKCSFSGQQHIPLRGKTAHGQWRTSQAQPYPPALCRQIAAALRTVQ